LGLVFPGFAVKQSFQPGCFPAAGLFIVEKTVENFRKGFGNQREKSYLCGPQKECGLFKVLNYN